MNHIWLNKKMGYAWLLWCWCFVRAIVPRGGKRPSSSQPSGAYFPPTLPFSGVPWTQIFEKTCQDATDLDLRNVVLVVTLRPLQLSHGLVLGAVHLMANPVQHLPLNTDVQLYEANVLLDAMRQIVHQEKSRYESLSCILAGDFNVPPFFSTSVFQQLTQRIGGAKQDEEQEEVSLPSPVYELLTRGNLSVESIGFLMTTIRASGLHPSQLLQGSLLCS